MKAKILINIPNLRALEKGLPLPEHESSCFSILPGEDLDNVMLQHGLSVEEANVYTTRILRGNPHWVELEHKVEVKKAEEVKVDLQAENKRKDELSRLNKTQQSELLVKLGVDKKKVPASESDRIVLIMELEKKK